MHLPPHLKQKYVARFDELIAEGERVVATLESRGNPDTAAILEWGTKCASLLTQILPKNHPRRSSIPNYGVQHGCHVTPPVHLPQLKAIRDDFVNGFLDDLGSQ